MCWRQLAHNLSPGSKHTYDLQNQLTSATYYDGTGSASSDITKTYEYTYDTAGNILTSTVDGETKTYTYGNSQWNDLLTEYNGIKIYYEGQEQGFANAPVSGNPISYYNGNRWAMEWEHGRNLTKSFTMATNTTVISESKFDIVHEMLYTYDAEGIRTSRTYTTTIYGYRKSGDGTSDESSSYDRYLVSSSEVEHQYVTQNGKAVRETVISGGVTRVLDYIYDESGRPSSLIYTNGSTAPVTYYYVLNLQGDVEKIIDANGVVQAQYTYDPWGLVLSITNGDGNSVSNTHIGKLNSLRYRGYCGDTETQWYYLQSRYYDPVTHRFINADSLASTGQGVVGTNMFAYCSNNPVNRLDSLGMFWEEMGNWLRVTDEKIEEYLNAGNICGTAISGLSITTTAITSYLINAIQNSSRPNNIGVGTYAKQCANDIQAVSKVGNKISQGLTIAGYVAVAIDVGIGIYDNINNGASTKRIITDATVDVAVTGASIWAAGAAGSSVGAALGSVCPVVGNAIGAGVGFVVGIGIYAFTDMITFDGKSARSWIKEMLNGLW